MSDSTSLDDIRQEISDETYQSLLYLTNVKIKLEKLQSNYTDALIATGTQLKRSLVDWDEISAVYRYLKDNDFVNRSKVFQLSGYNAQKLSYYTKQAKTGYPDRNYAYLVYVLIKDNQIVYVGRSTDLKARLRQHRKDKTFDRFEYKICKDRHEMQDLEALLIQQFNPKYNVRVEKRSDR